MEPTLITLILNIVLGFFVLWGFLWGLKGLKKSTKSLIVFIVSVIICLFITTPISKLVLGINIGGNTIEGTILEGITSSMGENLANNEGILNIVRNIPVMVINIAVWMILLFVVGFICKIIGAIIYKIIFKKDKEKQVEVCEIVNGSPQMKKRTVKVKKRRLLGGLVGMVHGFLFAIVLVFPLIGVCNVVNDIVGTSEVVAEETSSESSFEFKPVKSLLQENLPKEFYDYAKAIDNSIFASVGKVGGLAETSLNTVAKCSINGQTVSLANEVRTLIGVYDDFVGFVNQASETLGTTDFNAILDDIVAHPDNYNFTELEAIIDNLFNSNLIQAVGNDALAIGAEFMVTEETPEDSVLKYIQKALYSYVDGDYKLKDDIKTVFKVLEIGVKKGVVKEALNENVTFDSIKNILIDEENNNEVLASLCTEITKSNLLQKLVLEMTNYGTYHAEKAMNENFKFKEGLSASIDEIDSTQNITITATSLYDILVKANEIYEQGKDIDFEKVGEDFTVIFDYEIGNIVALLGEELQYISDLQIFSTTNVFASLCDSFANTEEYSKYINFDKLKQSDSIKNQLGYIGNALTEVKGTNIAKVIKDNDEDVTKIVEDVIDELVKQNENNVSHINSIVSNLLKCDIFENTIKLGLTEAHNAIEGVVDGLVEEDVVLSDFTTNGLFTEIYNAELIALLEDLAEYLSTLNISEITDESALKTILNGDLDKLGIALDSIKNSKLFASGDVNTFTDLVDILYSSDIGEFIDLRFGKDQEYSYETELKALKDFITIANTITIESEPFIDYVMDGNSLDSILDYITQADALKLKPLFEILVVKPTAVIVVDSINNIIKDYVGEELGINIKAISYETDLKAQADSIINVISAAVEIDFNKDISEIDSTKFNLLLGALESNANANGVFKESYNALLNKIVVEINSEVEKIITDNVENTGITTLVEPLEMLENSMSIRSLLTSALNLSRCTGPIDIKNSDVVTMLVDLIQKFSVCKEIANLKNTYNAILVYSINMINKTIYDCVNKNYFPDYEDQILTGSTNLVGNYDNNVGDIIEIIVSANNALATMDEGDGLEDITSELLTIFVNQLDDIEWTKSAHNAILNSLAGQVIDEVNGLTDNSDYVHNYTNLSGQSSTILSVVDSALKLVPTLKEENGALISSMAEETKTACVKLLNTLQDNALASGVFTESYNELIGYFEEQNNLSDGFIVDNFTDSETNKINWTDAFAFDYNI